MDCERYLAIEKRLPSLAQSEVEALVPTLPQQVTEAQQAELLGRLVVCIRGPRRDRLLALALSLADPAAHFNLWLRMLRTR
jgi:hypothetical protein